MGRIKALQSVFRAIYTIAFFAVLGAVAIVAGTVIMLATYYALISF